MSKSVQKLKSFDFRNNMDLVDGELIVDSFCTERNIMKIDISKRSRDNIIGVAGPGFCATSPVYVGSDSSQRQWV